VATSTEVPVEALEAEVLIGEHRSMAPRVLHHLAFRTDDVDRLTTFYREVVGLPLRDGGSPGRSTWLALGDAIVMIERADPGETLVARDTKELVAFRLEAAAMASLRDTLARAHVAIETETRFTIYARDPDGRRIAFSHYPDEPPAT
jgi:glyoxylase I family protein